MDFSEKTILITGGSRGLGRALAAHFAALGARLLLAARDAEGLAETARLVKERGGTCETFRLDLTCLESIQALAEWLRAGGERVDVLINNAADVTSKPFLDTSNEEIHRLLQTNVVGPLQLTRLLVPSMLERGGGAVVNVSSLAGYKPNTSQTAYSVSKAAVNGMSEALEAEFADKGIHVMNVALPPIGEGPGRMPSKEYARRLEHALRMGKVELFMHRRSKWLMRVYRFCPALARMRRSSSAL